MNRLINFLLLVGTLILTLGARANVQIEGNIAFQRQGDQVSIQIDRIANYSETRTTGTLHVRIFARTSADPFGQGYWVTDINLYGLNNGTGQLSPSTAFTSLRLNGAWQTPPDGTYYLHLYVTEYPDLTTALDTRTFDGTFTFGDVVQPPPPPPPADCQPQLSNCELKLSAFSPSHSSDTLQVSYQVENVRNYGSGQWYLSVFVCDQPWVEEFCNGTLLILGESSVYSGISGNNASAQRSLSLNTEFLSDGTYYIAAQVYRYNGQCIVDGFCVDYDTRFSSNFASFSFQKSSVVIPPPPATPTVIGNNQSMSSTIDEGQWHYYELQTSSTAESVSVQLNNMTSDVDLYVRIRDLPTLETYDCVSNNGSTQTDACSLSVSGSTKIMIGVYGFSASSYSVAVQEVQRQTTVVQPPQTPDSGGGGSSTPWILVWLFFAYLLRKRTL